MINIALNSNQQTLTDYFPLSIQPELLPKKPKAKRRKTETWMARMMWALSGPIIVMPGYQTMPIPEDVRSQISMERLLLLAKDESLSSEAEAMWYISTASLVAPLSLNWVNIQLYLCRKWMLKLNKPLPDFLQQQINLEPYMEEETLHRLRSWLFKRSFEHLRGRLRSL